MTPHFIEVHKHGKPFSICLAQMVSYDGLDDTHAHIIMTTSPNTVHIDETYADLLSLIRHAGSAITKADPRLDNSHWISWDDLTKLDMIGQPVFNSNTRKWMLVIDSAGPYTHDWIVLLNDAGGQERWNEHDVQKFPLYRMRKEM